MMKRINLFLSLSCITILLIIIGILNYKHNKCNNKFLNCQKQIKIISSEKEKLKIELNNCEQVIKKKKLSPDIILKIVKPFIANNVPYSIAKEIIDETLNYYYPDPLFINSIIIVESNYNIMAISNAKAVGCMQVNYNLWNKELKQNGIIKEYRDLFDPHICVQAGMYILMKYYNQTGNWEKALNKYVGGSKKYVDKVFKIYGILNMRLKEINNKTKK